MIEILFAFSAIINIFLVWYIMQLLKRVLTFQDELYEFGTKLEEYEGHVKMINELERFYGDSTLSNLLRHSKDMANQCRQFQFVLLEQEEEQHAEEEEY